MRFFVRNFGAKNYKAEMFALQFFGAKISAEKARKNVDEIDGKSL